MRAFPCYPLLSLSHCISFVLFYSFLYFFSLTFFAPQILRNILPAARLGGSQAGLPGKAEAATLDAKLARTITGLHALPPILQRKSPPSHSQAYMQTRTHIYTHKRTFSHTPYWYRYNQPAITTALQKKICHSNQSNTSTTTCSSRWNKETYIYYFVDTNDSRFPRYRNYFLPRFFSLLYIFPRIYSFISFQKCNRFMCRILLILRNTKCCSKQTPRGHRAMLRPRQIDQTRGQFKLMFPRFKSIFHQLWRKHFQQSGASRHL